MWALRICAPRSNQSDVFKKITPIVPRPKILTFHMPLRFPALPASVLSSPSFCSGHSAVPSSLKQAIIALLEPLLCLPLQMLFPYLHPLAGLSSASQPRRCLTWPLPCLGLTHRPHPALSPLQHSLFFEIKLVCYFMFVVSFQATE